MREISKNGNQQEIQVRGLPSRGHKGVQVSESETQDGPYCKPMSPKSTYSDYKRLLYDNGLCTFRHPGSHLSDDETE